MAEREREKERIVSEHQAQQGRDRQKTALKESSRNKIPEGDEGLW